MSHIAFVGPEIEENLSLRYLASTLAEHGHTTDIVPFNQDADFVLAIETILEKQPILVGLSLAFQWRASDFLALAVALRERGYRGHITAGGHFATFESLPLLRDFPELDSIVRQEAEVTIVDLARAVERGEALGEIPGLAVRDESGEPRTTGEARLPDIARLPTPDRRGEPARCFGHGIAPLGLEPWLLRELLVLLHCRLARAESARQALPGARSGRCGRRNGRAPASSRHRHLRLSRRQLLRSRSQEEPRALQRPRRRSGASRNRALCHGGQSSSHRLRPGGVSHPPRSTELHPGVYRDRNRHGPGSDDASAVEHHEDESQGDRARARARSLHVLQHADLRSGHHAGSSGDEHRVHPLGRRVSVELRARGALRWHAALGAHAGRGALSRRLHAVGLRPGEPRGGAHVRPLDALFLRRAISAKMRSRIASWRPASTWKSLVTSIPELFQQSWLERGKELSRRLATDGADGLARILDHVRTKPTSEDERLVEDLGSESSRRRTRRFA